MSRECLTNLACMTAQSMDDLCPVCHEEACEIMDAADRCERCGTRGPVCPCDHETLADWEGCPL